MDRLLRIDFSEFRIIKSQANAVFAIDAKNSLISIENIVTKLMNTIH